MKRHLVMPLVFVAAQLAGCADMNSLASDAQYGDVGSAGGSQLDRSGRITDIQTIQSQNEPKFGVGTAVGAVTGAAIGSQMGHGVGSTMGAITGGAIGAATGTYAQNRLARHDAQRVTVLTEAGEVTIVQPPDHRLFNGMEVRVESSGDTARVVPR